MPGVPEFQRGIDLANMGTCAARGRRCLRRQEPDGSAYKAPQHMLEADGELLAGIFRQHELKYLGGAVNRLALELVFLKRS